MRTNRRRLAVALAAAGLLVAAGCAKDEAVSTSQTTVPVTAASSGSGSGPADGTTPPDDEGEDPDADKGEGTHDEVCDIIEEIDGLGDDEMAEAVALMEQASDLSSGEMADHWTTLAGIFEEIAAVDPGSEEETAAMIDLLGDPDFLEAAAAIDDFAEEECGMDIGLDPSEDGDTSGSTDDEIGASPDDDIGAPADGDLTSIDSVQAYLEDFHGTEDWWPVLEDASGWSVSGSTDVVWTIDLSASSEWDRLTDADLVAACEAIADYLYVNGDYGTVSVEIADPDEVVIVSSFEGEECEVS